MWRCEITHNILLITSDIQKSISKFERNQNNKYHANTIQHRQDN